MEIAMMAHDHCCVPLCNNDKRYNSGKDLSLIFNFPTNKQQTKPNAIFRMHNLITYLEYNLYARPASFLIQKGRNMRGHLVPLTQGTGMHLIASVPEQAKDYMESKIFSQR